MHLKIGMIFFSMICIIYRIHDAKIIICNAKLKNPETFLQELWLNNLLKLPPSLPNLIVIFTFYILFNFQILY